MSTYIYRRTIYTYICTNEYISTTKAKPQQINCVHEIEVNFKNLINQRYTFPELLIWELYKNFGISPVNLIKLDFVSVYTCDWNWNNHINVYVAYKLSK